MIDNDKKTGTAALGKCLGVLVAILTLSACSSQHYGDLDKYIEDVKHKTKGRIEPLPEVKTYESYTYQAQDLRDPFTPFTEAPAEQMAQPGITPDIHRKREALEAFPLDSLKFVGTIEKDGATWGLITAPDKAIYRVQVGNHMGKNYGEIMSLNESTILLKEIIPNGSGGWVERQASLALSE
jgi:type IV pilus assembly protein PilP